MEVKYAAAIAQLESAPRVPDGTPPAQAALEDVMSFVFRTLRAPVVLLVLYTVGVGMSWIHSSGGEHAVVYPKASEGECTGAMKFFYITPARAFAAMDTDSNGDLSMEEWEKFAYRLNNGLTAHGQKTMNVMSCYQEYDLNLDGAAITNNTFFQKVGSEYDWDGSNVNYVLSCLGLPLTA